MFGSGATGVVELDGAVSVADRGIVGSSCCLRFCDAASRSNHQPIPRGLLRDVEDSFSR